MQYLIYTESNLNVVDALFESMSGITTTGATIMHYVESLQRNFNLEVLQWLGGIGIVVIALFILFLHCGTQLFH